MGWKIINLSATLQTNYEEVKEMQDSNESINVIRDDHDYLNWSQKSTWPVIQNGT